MFKKYALLMGLSLATSHAMSLQENEVNDIQLNKGDQSFVVQLQSNPTTGYRWQLQDYDTHAFTLLSHQYIPPHDKRIGTGGVETWEFGVSPKAYDHTWQQTLHFVYQRSWEQQPGQAVSVKVSYQKGD